MTVRTCATFTADLPDDHIEDGPTIVQFGGKSVVAAIGEILTRLGCAVSPPIYADEHGWQLRAKFGKRRFWCQVTLIDGWVMVFEDRTFLGNLLGYHRLYLEILTQLARELGRDPRFHDVAWFRSDEVLTGVVGAAEPVSG